MNAALLEAVRFFTRETEIMSGLSVACGDGSRLETAWDGTAAGERTVFDLASVTKLFTALCAMKLKEEGLLDFSRPVSAYAPAFRGLSGVTVDQLMSFQLMIRTPGRIDACETRDQAEDCLLAAAPAGLPGRRAYSDIPAMILKYVIEGAAGLPLSECVRRMILLPAGMTETWAEVPEDRLKDCELYDGEHRIEGEKRLVRRGFRGVPHDPKAAVLQGRGGDLCGHAGLFSTRQDLVRFCRAVLAGRVVGEASLREMAVNRTGRPWPEGGYSQYLGRQCYLRHPDQYFSEIPAYMGGWAFGIGGFTGNHLSLDPERGIFTVMLGNRVRDRLTVLIPPEGRTLTDYGLLPDGRGRIRWEDGRLIPSSVQYVHQKDEHLHRVIAEVTGWKPVSWAEAAERNPSLAGL